MCTDTFETSYRFIYLLLYLSEMAGQHFSFFTLPFFIFSWMYFCISFFIEFFLILILYTHFHCLFFQKLFLFAKINDKKIKISHVSTRMTIKLLEFYRVKIQNSRFFYKILKNKLIFNFPDFSGFFLDTMHHIYFF